MGSGIRAHECGTSLSRSDFLPRSQEEKEEKPEAPAPAGDSLVAGDSLAHKTCGTFAVHARAAVTFAGVQSTIHGLPSSSSSIPS